jgi:ribonuclease G
MYNVDDAVAKIDGYIISVTAGGAHVGEKRLVRIEEAGRTAATASLVDAGAPPGEEGRGDGVQSRPRRRGRRGGRRRSRARGTEPAGEAGDSKPVSEKT